MKVTLGALVRTLLGKGHPPSLQAQNIQKKHRLTIFRAPTSEKKPISPALKPCKQQRIG